MPVRALNLYYARDADARAQVLATRLRATEVRQRIGIARGRVFVRVNGDAELPDVMWDCPFPQAGAHDQDMQARAASSEFEACRAIMRTLTRRFERVIYDEVQGRTVQELPVGEELVQMWLNNIGVPEIEVLCSLSAATALHRSDDNTRLPDWIVEPSGDGDQLPIKDWIARHDSVKMTIAHWQRVA